MQTKPLALISCSDKSGLETLAKFLVAHGYEILSTGGSAKYLRDHGISSQEVSDYTGFPEMMEGRLKTLHPKIHGGILARRGIDDSSAKQHGIHYIDLVVVNLYPFQTVIQDTAVTLETAIENIDIGGPAMLRAAAKNYAHVTALVDPNDYADFMQQLSATKLTAEDRYKFAVKAFAHTAQYDGAIANFLSCRSAPNAPSTFPEYFSAQWHKQSELRYGENPHQQAALYLEPNPAAGCVASAYAEQGKALSYNNLADADVALECVKRFSEPSCVIVKHNNPCGAASAASLEKAYQRAFHADPTSAFGGIVACNQKLDATTAEIILGSGFMELIIAPEITAEALDLFAAKPNLRVLQCGYWQTAPEHYWDLRRINGGLLLQDQDHKNIQAEDLQCVTTAQVNEAAIADCIFAWRIAKFVKSNAIVLAKNLQTLGIGVGQTSRLDSTRFSIQKALNAKHDLQGAVLASDAFFPFRDNVDAAAAAGVRYIIQPGGSIRDAEVIAAANEHGIAMLFTGFRHFRH